MLNPICISNHLETFNFYTHHRQLLTLLLNWRADFLVGTFRRSFSNFFASFIPSPSNRSLSLTEVASKKLINSKRSHSLGVVGEKMFPWSRQFCWKASLSGRLWTFQSHRFWLFGQDFGCLVCVGTKSLDAFLESIDPVTRRSETVKVICRADVVARWRSCTTERAMPNATLPRMCFLSKAHT